MGSYDASQPDVVGALFGKTRRSVLGLLLARPDESFYLREIVRQVRCGQGGVQRELKRLERAGILSRTIRGRTVFYRANPDCPALDELRALVVGRGPDPNAAGSGSTGPRRAPDPPDAPPASGSALTEGGRGQRWHEDMPSELL